MLVPDALESARLLLRPLVPGDLPALVEIHADPDVTRYLPGPQPRPPAFMRDWLEHTLRMYAREGLGHCGVVRKADGRLIGRCGVTCYEVEAGPPAGPERRCTWGRGSAPPGLPVTEAFELGYTFARDAWGSGYATEAAAAMRDHAFASGLARLISLIHPDNRGSARVAAKLGLQVQERVSAFGGIFVCHAIERAQWHAAPGGPAA